MKVLVINCGSSSLKYQLIDMDGEDLCKDTCERIGVRAALITPQTNGTKATTAIFPTHTRLPRS